MSLRKKGVITKISSVSLFIFLMLFNVKVAFSDKSSGDIDIFGMKISVSVPSAYASNNAAYCMNWPRFYCKLMDEVFVDYKSHY